MFLRYCRICIENSKRKKSIGVIIKPILSIDFNSRAQMDLVDFQSLPDNGYKWIYFCYIIIIFSYNKHKSFKVAYGLSGSLF